MNESKLNKSDVKSYLLDADDNELEYFRQLIHQEISDRLDEDLANSLGWFSLRT